MALICGIDQSSGKTGLALWDPTEPPSTMRLHSFKATGKSDFEKVISFCRQLEPIVRNERPDLIAFEAPIKRAVEHKQRRKDFGGEREESVTNANTVRLLAMVVGAMVRGLEGKGYKLPETPGASRFYVEVPSNSWRSSFLGYCSREKLDAAGHVDRSKKEIDWSAAWKRAAKEQCDRLSIAARNMDQADAAGIAFWASGCDAWKLLNARAA